MPVSVIGNGSESPSPRAGNGSDAVPDARRPPYSVVIDDQRNDAAERVVALLDTSRRLDNTGAIFRTADACGVERVVRCGITPRPDQDSRQRRAIANTALGAGVSVPWEAVTP